MLIRFNIERLDKLLYDFHKITGLTVSVWDAQLNRLSHQPKEMCGFCRKIREYPEGAHRCFMSDRGVIMECAKTGKPATRLCHAGLVDTAVPIKFKETVCGYIMFGQAVGADSEVAYKRIMDLCKELGADPQFMLSLYEGLQHYDAEKINAAANILKMSTRYLWLSGYMEVSYDINAARIENYIMANLAGDLSVRSICENVGIPKNRLYSISHEFFGTPIGDYVTAVRINEAKRLLNTTDLSVSEIAVLVGISDYNYFTKLFKTKVGISARAYRKAFPFGYRAEVPEQNKEYQKRWSRA